MANVEYRMGPTALAPAAVEDCRCALRWVREHAAEFKLDPSRIVVTGHSAGGHLSLTTGMLTAAAGFDSLCPKRNADPAAGGLADPVIEEMPVAAIVNWFGITDVGDLLAGEHAKVYAMQWMGSLPNRARARQAALAAVVGPRRLAADPDHPRRRRSDRAVRPRRPPPRRARPRRRRQPAPHRQGRGPRRLHRRAGARGVPRDPRISRSSRARAEQRDLPAERCASRLGSMREPTLGLGVAAALLAAGMLLYSTTAAQKPSLELDRLPGADAAQPRPHPRRRPSLRRDGLHGAPVHRDAEPRLAGARRRPLPQRGGHHRAVLAEPRLDPHRALHPSPSRRRQQQPGAGRAGVLSAVPAGGRLPDRVHRQVAHGSRQRRAAARVRPLGELPRAGDVLSRWADLERRRRARAAPRLRHRRAHRLRRRLARPARSRAGRSCSTCRTRRSTRSSCRPSGT